jgi:lipopolysaccharide export system protein LptC
MKTQPRDLLVAGDTKIHLFHGYGWVTKGLRVLLGLAILAVLVAVLLWPIFDSPSHDVAPPPPDVSTVNNELVNPKFEAVDGSGQPFTLTADLAVQNRDHADLVDLTAPQGVLHLTTGATLTLTAPRGFYRQDQKVLDLAGGVTLISSEGHRATTEAVTLDLTHSTLEGHRPVTVDSPLGTLQAARVSGTGAGMVLTFHGPATMILK